MLTEIRRVLPASRSSNELAGAQGIQGFPQGRVGADQHRFELVDRLNPSPDREPGRRRCGCSPP
jgi:hypothetical protein